jgi:hypothetical protein
MADDTGDKHHAFGRGETGADGSFEIPCQQEIFRNFAGNFGGGSLAAAQVSVSVAKRYVLVMFETRGSEPVSTPVRISALGRVNRPRELRANGLDSAVSGRSTPDLTLR